MGNEVLNTQEVLELLNTDSSVKILVTLDETGLPHPVVKSSLQRDGKHIIYTGISGIIPHQSLHDQKSLV